MKKHLALLLLPLPIHALADDWIEDHPPFALYGNSYYVGSKGLSSVLITSPAGHVLIDGTVKENAAMIADHVRKLGFRVEDIKYILSSHAHSDHAGGIAALQRLSGAEVLGGAATLPTLRDGVARPEDPQFGDLTDFPGNANARAVADGEVVRLGPLAITAHATPGHTAGGTSWSWESCDGGRCMKMVYIDSLTAVGAKGYQFRRHPEIVASLRHSIAMVGALPCDVAITAHPDAIGLLDKPVGKDSLALVDRRACRGLATRADQTLNEKLAAEKE
ncbi:MAG TPA: subclass B3 metallo-beta-lactamase [Burkholderiaceae bacterium]|nr:subclass B3 metallo-beta-lactamase [Burkholderiaceae bacterium]